VFLKLKNHNMPQAIVAPNQWPSEGQNSTVRLQKSPLW